MSSSENSSTSTEPPSRQGQGSRRPLIIAALIALLVVVLGVVSLLLHHNPSTPSSSSSLQTATTQVGSPVPQFSLPNLTGSGAVGVPQNGGGHGKAAVLVFFASWCGPCQQEMPGLTAAIANGAAGNAVVIGVDGADQLSAAQAFVAKDNILFPIGVDSNYSVTSGLFGFSGLPETVFVNAKGIITEIHFGPTTPALLRQGVRGMGAN